MSTDPGWVIKGCGNFSIFKLVLFYRKENISVCWEKKLLHWSHTNSWFKKPECIQASYLHTVKFCPAPAMCQCTSVTVAESFLQLVESWSQITTKMPQEYFKLVGCNYIPLSKLCQKPRNHFKVSEHGRMRRQLQISNLKPCYPSISVSAAMFSSQFFINTCIVLFLLKN